MDATTQVILERLLELLIGILAIISFHQRVSGGLSARDLLRKIEEKDRQIERLRIQKGKHNYRSLHARNKHLHSSAKKYTL